MNPRVFALLLRPSRGSLGIVVLPAVAFAIVTALILVVFGGAQKFWTWTDDLAGLYQGLAVIALVLLVVPLANLGGAAARLSARRRDERLSTLRLLGVTPLGVAGATVLESAIIAALGALVGVVCYLAVAPLIGLIPFRGEALGWTAILLPPLIIAAIVLGVVILAALSAVAGLRRVIISPLGVRLRTSANSVRGVRAVIAVALLVVAFVVATIVPHIGGLVLMVVVAAVLFAGALALLGLLGPWVLSARARRQARKAETPSLLLAARTVLNDPKAAWRQVSGVAMASFMAVFAGSGVSLVSMLQTEGVPQEQQYLGLDMRTGLLITLAGSFLMVACSVGVNQAANILDHRDLHTSLRFLGMEARTMDDARRRAIMSPLLTTTIGSALCAFLLVFPIVGMAIVAAPLSMLTIALVVAAGIGIVWVSTRVTAPLLRRGFADA